MPNPIAPHLRIYKLQLTSLMSILHRVSGICAIAVMLCVIAFLGALAIGEESYGAFCRFLGNPIVKVAILLGLTCIYYHLLNGIRYLVWGVGFGQNIKCFYRSGFVVFAAVIALAVFTGVTLWR